MIDRRVSATSNQQQSRVHPIGFVPTIGSARGCVCFDACAQVEIKIELQVSIMHKIYKFSTFLLPFLALLCRATCVITC
jgi:hypothetical protein